MRAWGHYCELLGAGDRGQEKALISLFKLHQLLLAGSDLEPTPLLYHMLCSPASKSVLQLIHHVVLSVIPLGQVICFLCQLEDPISHRGHHHGGLLLLGECRLLGGTKLICCVDVFQSQGVNVFLEALEVGVELLN